jgi:ATP-dependent DNA ligase
VFEVLAFNGRALYKQSIEKRIEVLQNISYGFDGEYIEFAEYFEGKELWNQLQSILASGGEGIVITKKGTCYQPGKRPARQTFKVKKELQETIDVVVLDANPPTRLYNGKEIMTWQYWEDLKTGERLKGSFYKNYSDGEAIEPVTKNYWNGWAGSLVIGMRKDDKLVVVGSLSGMTEEVLANWEDYKGRVAEITGMQIMETGGIRHPKFIQWRDDLTAKDTDWYRNFGEERS